MTAPVDPEFEALLELLREQRGFDFTGYKRASLMRRVSRRMQQVGIESYADYMDYLQLAPDEYTALFNTLLINVTSFFRDLPAWQFLQAELLPRLLGELPEEAPLRVWSAGCATGEEAYTLAIVLCEVLGPDVFRQRVKIYGTDVDEDALSQARTGVYTDREISNVPDDLVPTYFEQHGQRYTFRKDLRRSVIFGRNDLVQDAPISHLGLLSCRNTLMYFNAETQSRVLDRMHFALNSGGLLMLGKAEMLLGHAELFAPVDLRRRMFRKVRRAVRERELLLAPPAELVSGQLDLRERAFRTNPLPQAVVSADGRLLLINEQAEALLNLSVRDIGRPFQDLEVSYRPVELRSLIEEALTQRRTVWRHETEWYRSGQQSFYDIQVVPLLDVNGPLGTSIAFHDVTRYRRLQEDLERSNRQLETAYEELQSTNEELETMNEELQSTNDEFQTMNDELRDRTEEVETVNSLMQSVLTSLRDIVIVIDRDLRVLVWNQPAQELWGLRQDEAIGESLMTLDIGLPMTRLNEPLRQALDGKEQRQDVPDAVDRRGRAVHLAVALSPLVMDGHSTGAVLVMKAQQPESLVG